MQMWTRTNTYLHDKPHHNTFHTISQHTCPNNLTASHSHLPRIFAPGWPLQVITLTSHPWQYRQHNQLPRILSCFTFAANWPYILTKPCPAIFAWTTLWPRCGQARPHPLCHTPHRLLFSHILSHRSYILNSYVQYVGGNMSCRRYPTKSMKTR